MTKCPTCKSSCFSQRRLTCGDCYVLDHNTAIVATFDDRPLPTYWYGGRVDPKPRYDDPDRGTFPEIPWPV